VYNYAGNDVVFHGGAVQGYRGAMALLPGKDLGVVLLWNSESALPSGLLPTILDSALGLADGTWLDDDIDIAEPSETLYATQPVKNAGGHRRFVGRHRLAVLILRTRGRTCKARRHAKTRRAKKKKPLPPGQREGSSWCCRRQPGHARAGRLTSDHRSRDRRDDGRLGLLRGLLGSLLGSRLLGSRLLRGSLLGGRLLRNLLRSSLLGSGFFATFFAAAFLAAGFFATFFAAFLAAGFFATFFAAFLAAGFFAAAFFTAFFAAGFLATFFAAFLAAGFFAAFFAAFLTAMVWLLVNG
jgi:hypothetical protein